MPYEKNEDGTFTVTSRSGSIHKWIVNAEMTACNCPKFRFILKGQSHCHHITEVLGGIKTKPVKKGYLTFDQATYTNSLTMREFIEVYGDEQYDRIMTIPDIILHKGKVVILK